MLVPILFLVYVIDFHISCNENHVILFADDTTILKNINRKTKIMSLKLVKDTTRLSQKHDKTKKMVFPRRFWNNKSQDAKFLGVMLYSKLTWQSEIYYLHKKLPPKIFTQKIF